MTVPVADAPAAERRSLGARALRRLERRADTLFGEGQNPLRQLGAIAFALFWTSAASGIYLYVLFDTSVTGAYRSVEAITNDPWLLGGFVRGVHRYASDAFVVVALLHLARELVLGRFRGFRWFTWVSGVPLVALAFLAAAGGYALVWDVRAQYTLTALAEWLGWLPGFGEAIVRNFVAEENLSDRFFSLVVFLHIAVPLFLLAGMWIHIQRITRPVTRPSSRVAVALGLVIACTAAFLPAVSLAPADLARVPARLVLDWIALAPLPLVMLLTPRDAWILAAALLLVLVALPWLGRAPRPPIAVVDAQNCNGCERCFADCPYEAVVMAPHPLRPHRKLAVVRSDLCAACGICAGACPSATPFRSIDSLATGIDMPQRSVDALRERLVSILEARRGRAPVILFGCDRGADVTRLASDTIEPISLICAGQLPPSFIDYAMRHGAKGVLIAPCPEGDCEYRLGTRWTRDRMARVREPHLRASVPQERLRITVAATGEEPALAAALARFEAELAAGRGQRIASHA